METINKERVKEIVKGLKERVEKEADILSLYILAFGDVEYDGNDADPRVKLTTLYQYLHDNITNFESADFSLDSFNSFISELYYTDHAVYRYDKYNLKKIFPLFSYDDEVMSTSFLHTATEETSTRISSDNYLRAFSEYILNMQQMLENEYTEAREERKNIYIIRNNVYNTLNRTMIDMEKKCNADGIIDFYDFIYKQIEGYGKEDN